MEWLSSIGELLKKIPHLAAPFAIASGIVLFAGEETLKPLGLVEFRENGKPYLGAVFLVSLAIVICQFFACAFAWARGHYRHYLARCEIMARLKCLTKEEKKLLGGYLKGQTRTLAFDRENGVVAGLVKAGVLYPAVGVADIFAFPINVGDVAWQYINKHPHLVSHGT